jgi:hypothetical protein
LIGPWARPSRVMKTKEDTDAELTPEEIALVAKVMEEAMEGVTEAEMEAWDEEDKQEEEAEMPRREEEIAEMEKEIAEMEAMKGAVETLVTGGDPDLEMLVKLGMTPAEAASLAAYAKTLAGKGKLLGSWLKMQAGMMQGEAVKLKFGKGPSLSRTGSLCGLRGLRGLLRLLLVQDLHGRSHDLLVRGPAVLALFDKPGGLIAAIVGHRLAVPSPDDQLGLVAIDGQGPAKAPGTRMPLVESFKG